MATRQQILTRHWVHSHEEDTATQTVFRPATYDFPLSRGRRSFELRPDGTVLETLDLTKEERHDEFLGNCRVPSEPFRFVARGVERDGRRYEQRTAVMQAPRDR